MHDTRSLNPAMAATILVPLAIQKVAAVWIGVWATALLPFAIGSILLGSLVVGRPLIGMLARRWARSSGGGHAARLEVPRVQRALTAMTAIWGIVLVAEAAFLAELAGTQSATTFADTSFALTWGVQGALIAGTVLFVRRRRAASSGQAV